VRRWLAAAAGLLVFAALAIEISLGGTPWFDEPFRALIHRHARSALTEVMRAFSLFGEPIVLVALGFIAVVLLALIHRVRTALQFAYILVGAELIDEVLKVIFHRARPAPFFGYAEPAGYSFPSGHALMACTFFSMLALMIRTRNCAARSLVWALAVFCIAAIGLSRIYLGVHYPSDVLAGYAVGVVWVACLAPATPPGTTAE
jgi:undecaprenyl-diphosphatase